MVEKSAEPEAIGEPMLADIRRQPELLSGLLERLDEIQGFGAEHLKPDRGGCLYAFGCGDGWFAARAAAPLLECGVAYRAQTALTFLIYTASSYDSANRALAISMSGNVDRTVEAAAAAPRAAVLTNGSGGRLGELTDTVLRLGIPGIAPFLCGTSSYTATLLALLMAIAPRDGDPAQRFQPDEAARLIGSLSELIAKADQQLAAIAGEVAPDLAGVRFLSAGANLASADYGAAKLVELTHIPVWSDDTEEFAHRQFWSADPRELVVYLPGNPTLARLASASAAALAEMGFRTLAMEPEGCPVATATYRLQLPLVAESLSPLCFAIPLQLLGYHLARATGLDPNTRNHLKDDALRFAVSRKLTRRSLVGTGR